MTVVRGLVKIPTQFRLARFRSVSLKGVASCFIHHGMSYSQNRTRPAISKPRLDALGIIVHTTPSLFPWTFSPDFCWAGLSNWVFMASWELRRARLVVLPLPFVKYAVTCNTAVSSCATDFAGGILGFPKSLALVAFIMSRRRTNNGSSGAKSNSRLPYLTADEDENSRPTILSQTKVFYKMPGPSGVHCCYLSVVAVSVMLVPK